MLNINYACTLLMCAGLTLRRHLRRAVVEMVESVVVLVSSLSRQQPVWVVFVVGCLLASFISQQHASVSQGQIFGQIHVFWL